MRILGFLMLACSFLGLAACGGDDSDRPIARISVECIDYLCTFDASESVARVGTGLEYAWSFGDGNGAFGQVVQHAYVEPADYEVELRVADDFGQLDQEFETVTIENTDTVEYFLAVQRSVTNMLFLFDTATTFVESADILQDEVEAAGVPPSNGYDLSCPVSGSAIVDSWDDANANLVIDNGEAVNLRPADCETETDRLLDSDADIGLEDDYDGTDFALRSPADIGLGVTTEQLERWSYRGDMVFGASRSSGDIVGLNISSPAASIINIAEEGGPNLIVDTSFNLYAVVPGPDNMTGSMDYRYGKGASNFQTNVVIDAPLVIDNTGDTPAISDGSFTVTFGTAIVAVSVDADPEYLMLEIDEDGNGSIDDTIRFPQSQVIVTFDDLAVIQ
ncbi:MAG: PKD domain-containing protein [Gammaproteobacteria bacterium]|nr:PKD domain-containing protein [Gammaproteobacteria bacterium]